MYTFFSKYKQFNHGTANHFHSSDCYLERYPPILALRSGTDVPSHLGTQIKQSILIIGAYIYLSEIIKRQYVFFLIITMKVNQKRITKCNQAGTCGTDSCKKRRFQLQESRFHQSLPSVGGKSRW